MSSRQDHRVKIKRIPGADARLSASLLASARSMGSETAHIDPPKGNSTANGFETHVSSFTQLRQRNSVQRSAFTLNPPGENLRTCMGHPPFAQEGNLWVGSSRIVGLLTCLFGPHVAAFILHPPGPYGSFSGIQIQSGTTCAKATSSQLVF